MGQVTDKFKIRQAAHLSGLTTYMVDYLCKSGILTPSASPRKPGRGTPRWFTFGDIVLLRVLQRLLEAGIPVSRMGKSIREFQRRHPDFTPGEIPGTYLVTDGKELFLKNHGMSALEDLSSGQFAFAFVVEIDSVCKEIAIQLLEAS